MIRLFLAFGFFATGSAAFADDVCRAVLADIGNVARPGVYLPTDMTQQHWRPLQATDSIVGGQVPIAYFRPGTHSGAIVVKVTRKLENGESPTQFVTIRRHDDIAQCDIGHVTEFIWWLFPKSYENGVSVTADDYLKYHRDRVANADLERFHIKYVGLGNVCLASNDPSNGNRAQFLFGKNRISSNPLVSTLERAGGTDSAVAGVIAGAGTAETILAVYAADDGCASFYFRSSGKGTYIFRINDLEQRESDQTRPKKEITRKLDVPY
jgi:hypothetical protein